MNAAQRFWARVDPAPGLMDVGHGSGPGIPTVTAAPIRAAGGCWRTGWLRLSTGGRSDGCRWVTAAIDKACQNPRHLFVGTRSQIQQNRRGAQANNRCGRRGVYWWAARRRWVAQAKHHGRTHYAGVWRSLEEADAAARAKRLELFTDPD